jgi:hypothetical protein
VSAASPRVYPAARLDGLARALTLLTWGLAAAITVAGAVTLGATPRWAAVLQLVVGAGLLGVCEVARRSRPVAYELDGEGVVVHRGGRAARRFAGAVRDVRPARLALRVAGSGGLYGYLGRFRATGATGQTVRAFVTDRDRVVLLVVGETRVALSPADPERFMAALREPQG